MAIARWNPWPELRAMQEQMTKLLEMSQELAGSEAAEQGPWQPLADIYENDHEVVIKLEVPEVEQEDIDVRVEDQTLVVRGARRLEWADERQNYQRIERHYGDFKRVFALPAGVDTEQARAGCDRGVLKIVLPKRDRRAARPIEIAVE